MSDKLLSNRERTALAVFMVALVLFCIWLLTGPLAGTLFRVIAVIMLAIVMGFLVMIVYEDYKHRKWLNARDHLREATREIYFYGYPVTECLDMGVVGGLAQYGVGDFAMQMGTLVLYALRNQMGPLHSKERAKQAEPVMYWQETTRSTLFPWELNSTETPEEHTKYLALVEFDYGGWRWRYNVWAHSLEVGLVRAKHSKKRANYTKWDYWDVPRASRYAIENCTDPERSWIAPGVYYADLKTSDFRERMAHEMKFITL